MGKCQSCCEPPGSSTETRFTNTHRPDYKLSQHVISKDKDKGTGDQGFTSMSIGKSSTSSDKKMFTPYPKLPPIKKQSNGDGKRLSFISRDVSESKILALFELYRDADEDLILAEGIEKFCSDLQVNPDEFIVLVIAWKFNAETMCRFTKEEFVNGCKGLKVDSIKGIQSKFTDLLNEVKNKQSFKEFYKWTYKFGLDIETGQKTLPCEMAMGLWKLIFSQNEPPILEHWIEFLEEHPSIRGIPRDTWDMFLNFVEQVGDDLSTYDDTEAWPSLLDDFVEYQNDKQNQNVKSF